MSMQCRAQKQQQYRPASFQGLSESALVAGSSLQAISPRTECFGLLQSSTPRSVLPSVCVACPHACLLQRAIVVRCGPVLSRTSCLLRFCQLLLLLIRRELEFLFSCTVPTFVVRVCLAIVTLMFLVGHPYLLGAQEYLTFLREGVEHVKPEDLHVLYAHSL
jgi:hypothetical protein